MPKSISTLDGTLRYELEADKVPECATEEFAAQARKVADGLYKPIGERMEVLETKMAAMEEKLFGNFGKSIQRNRYGQSWNMDMVGF